MYNSLKAIISFFVSPFLDLVEDLGLEDKVIKLGMGEIEFFNFSLYDLVGFVMGFIVILLFVKIVYKILKKITSMISGGYL